MNNYIITVTRQFGSLGRPIAKKLAEALGVAYYDRDIVDMTAKKLGVPLSVIGELEEAVQGRFFRMKYPLGMGTMIRRIPFSARRGRLSGSSRRRDHASLWEDARIVFCRNIRTAYMFLFTRLTKNDMKHVSKNFTCSRMRRRK